MNQKEFIIKNLNLSNKEIIDLAKAERMDIRSKYIHNIRSEMANSKKTIKKKYMSRFKKNKPSKSIEVITSFQFLDILDSNVNEKEKKLLSVAFELGISRSLLILKNTHEFLKKSL